MCKYKQVGYLFQLFSDFTNFDWISFLDASKSYGIELMTNRGMSLKKVHQRSFDISILISNVVSGAVGYCQFEMRR